MVKNIDRGASSRRAVKYCFILPIENITDIIILSFIKKLGQKKSVL